MKDWILYSLKCRKGQAGFALPVAIGMGLIILLVGLTMLLRSQDSQVSAIAQKDTAKSLNAAETGVNEIRALINQHRAIATAPACKADLNSPPTRNSNGTCPDSGLDVSWALPSNIDNILAECGVNRTGQITALANREWLDVDPSDASQGEYQLLDYDGAGLATVQGRVNAGQPSESISRLEVNFPVNPVEDRIAGLWVRNTANSSQVSADILGPCNSSAPIQSSALMMPPIPAEPSNPPSDITSLTGETFSKLPREDLDGNILDSPDSDGVYRYEIDTLTTSFDVDADKKIELWVGGDIDLQGKTIRHFCGTDPTCGPFGAKIFGESNSGTIILNNATTICDIFIHAPDYNVEASANVASAPTGCGAGTQNTGVFWVNQWGVSGNPILNSPRPKWSDIPQSVFVYPPRLGPVQKWETQSVS